MRAVFVVGLLGLLCPAIALAQAPAAPAPAAPAPAASSPPPAASATAPRRGGDITRDEYVERAKAAAERRFDAMDANHDGVLTAEERRAYRQGHSRRRGGAASTEPETEPQPAKSQ